jgi:hypothetical protein
LRYSMEVMLFEKVLNVGKAIKFSCNFFLMQNGSENC